MYSGRGIFSCERNSWINCLIHTYTWTKGTAKNMPNLDSWNIWSLMVNYFRYLTMKVLFPTFQYHVYCKFNFLFHKVSSVDNQIFCIGTKYSNQYFFSWWCWWCWWGGPYFSQSRLKNHYILVTLVRQPRGTETDSNRDAHGIATKYYITLMQRNLNSGLLINTVY